MAELAIELPQQNKRQYSEKKERLKFYRNKFSSAIEEVFIDREEDKVGFSEIFSGLTKKGKTKYDRTLALLQLAYKFMPTPMKEKVKAKFGYTQEEMPFDPEDYILINKIGKGGVNDVFLLEAQKEGLRSYVLKTIRLSYENGDQKRLLNIAQEQKAEYERIASVYQDIEGLISPEHYFILHGPRKSKAVVVVLQQFEGRQIRDIFDDFHQEDLRYLLERNDALSNQLKKFIDATNSDPSLLNNELDLLGRNNLVIVGENGNERLLLLDPHFRSVEHRSPQRQEEITRRFNYLSQLSEIIS
ncbi:hypothetical protein A2Z22_01685 [Candidatus Woesebacteria bacterium RBG_16_34_12]|uniref:Protein kinase domain-containing protein n=1 Tax=Candidatus Woesebacteria bacterium RBG_16_34_12 TaxID=1802480 RepID=A0A1F7XC75_9BACT|nr:MAG: hypothetical protein A2Z22_01685 [Candidatus Woesebacteria bacterium RBG_16_34_12]